MKKTAQEKFNFIVDYYSLDTGILVECLGYDEQSAFDLFAGNIEADEWVVDTLLNKIDEAHEYSHAYWQGFQREYAEFTGQLN